MWMRDNGSDGRMTLAVRQADRVASGWARFWSFPEGAAAGGELTGRGGYDCGGAFVDPSFLEGNRLNVQTSERSGNLKRGFNTEDERGPLYVSPIDLRGSPSSSGMKFLRRFDGTDCSRATRRIGRSSSGDSSRRSRTQCWRCVTSSTMESLRLRLTDRYASDRCRRPQPVRSGKR
jgi:hypothetical protein